MDTIPLDVPRGDPAAFHGLPASFMSPQAETLPASLVFELEDQGAALIGHSSEEDEDTKPAAHHMPLWALPLLFIAVMAVSSAGAVFATMRDVPPLTLAAWRLQLTTLLLFPGCIINYRSLPPDLKQRTHSSGRLYFISGTSLATHFASWVWGIEHTSLIHAYLLVSVTPIAIAAGTWLLRKPISNGELAGTALAAVGAGVLTLSPAVVGNQVTLLGDLASVGGAISVIGYLIVGQRLRAWMPIFLYACPVTGIGAIWLSMGAVIFENARPQVLGITGVFGWMSKDYIAGICYLAFVPGIIGHTGLNTVLKFLSPLVISLSTATEPLIGSLMGYFIGVLAPPNFWIYVGGCTVLAATVIVTVSQFRREAQARQGLGMGAHSLKHVEPNTEVGYSNHQV